MPLLLPLLLSAVGSFDWSAPESCPSEAAVRARVTESTSKVQATVEQLETGFELTVNIDGQVRILTTPSCEEAADTAVFLTELVGKKAGPMRKVVAPSSESLRSSRAESRDPPRTILHLSVLGGAEWLLLPRPVARFGASLQIELEWVTFTIDVRSAPALRFGGDSVFAVAIDIAPAFDLQVGVCRLFAVGPVRAGPCVQAGMGGIWAVGINVPIPHQKVIAVWTAGPALRVAVELGPIFEVQAFASARFGPRPAYYFEGFLPAVETSALGIDTGLGLGARW